MGLTSPDVRCGQFTLPEPGRCQGVPRLPLPLRLPSSDRLFPGRAAELAYAVAPG